MANVLTNALQFGKQTAPGVFLLQSDEQTAATFLNSATAAIGGDPEGEVFPVHVCYADTSVSTEWEIMYAAYSDTAGTITLTRSSTYMSSSSNAGIDFSTAPDEGLIFMGCPTSQNFEKLKSGSLFSGTNYTSTVNTPIFGSAMSDELIVTPSRPGLKLKASYNGEALIWNQSGSSQVNIRALCRLEWFDGSAWNSAGLAARFGWFGLALNTGIQFRFITDYVTSLSSSQINANGDWQLRLSGNPDGANISLTYDGANFLYEEAIE